MLSGYSFWPCKFCSVNFSWTIILHNGWRFRQNLGGLELRHVDLVSACVWVRSAKGHCKPRRLMATMFRKIVHTFWPTCKTLGRATLQENHYTRTQQEGLLWTESNSLSTMDSWKAMQGVLSINKLAPMLRPEFVAFLISDSFLVISHFHIHQKILDILCVCVTDNAWFCTLLSAHLEQ